MRRQRAENPWLEISFQTMNIHLNKTIFGNPMISLLKLQLLYWKLTPNFSNLK